MNQNEAKVFEFARCGVCHNYTPGEKRKKYLALIQLMESKLQSTPSTNKQMDAIALCKDMVEAMGEHEAIVIRKGYGYYNSIAAIAQQHH